MVWVSNSAVFTEEETQKVESFIRTAVDCRNVIGEMIVKDFLCKYMCRHAVEYTIINKKI